MSAASKAASKRRWQKREAAYQAALGGLPTGAPVLEPRPPRPKKKKRSAPAVTPVQPWTAHRVAYNEYIQSPEWTAKRSEFWAQSPRCCAACGSTILLHVHHMTYENMRNEPLSDLIWLCQDCHEQVHALHRVIRAQGYSLRAATMRIVKGKR